MSEPLSAGFCETLSYSEIAMQIGWLAGFMTKVVSLVVGVFQGWFIESTSIRSPLFSEKASCHEMDLVCLAGDRQFCK
jgi:hypothetical protein